MSRATIKDIAKLADVSIATVSRVLNDNPFVTDSVRERVLAATRELDYIPNTAAKILKTHRSHTIGFVISDISSEALLEAARAAETVVAGEDYNMILCSTENDPQREYNYLKMLISKNVDGIVLNTTGQNIDYVAEMSHQVPFVLYNRKIDSSNFIGDLVDTDNYAVSYQLTKQLLKLGHRRIMVVRGPMHLSNAADRFAGFVDAMRDEGIEITPDYPYVYTGNFCRQTGKDAVSYMMSLSNKPTALMSHNITMSIGVLEECSLRNIQIPEELSFISYDGIPNAELMLIRPTAAVYDVAEMGRRIGRLILERINNPKLENRSYIFAPHIVSGNSLSIPKGSL